MKIKQILQESSKILRENKIDEHILKAKILLANKLQKTKEYLIIHENEEISEQLENEYKKNISELINGKPLQYITNNQEFMKMQFYVDENVLIPRADTEILVEEVIRLSNQFKKNNIKILDLCTGSGAIAISLAKYIQNAIVYASDINEKSIDIANKNAKNNKVDIQFITSDLFKNINQKFDIIVSNPPYIATHIIKTLEKNVQKEPIIALDGGKDGLKFYKKIAQEANDYLETDGYLCLEIGYDQKKEVLELLKKSNYYKEIYSKKDLSRNDRIVIAKK